MEVTFFFSRFFEREIPSDNKTVSKLYHVCKLKTAAAFKCKFILQS